MAYIVCKDLTLGYEDGVVSDGVNFKVEKGDYLCVVGENGAGKSTLMKTLLHLVQPLGGDISYADDLKPYEVGYLPQVSDIQKDFPASCMEVVLSGNISKLGNRFFYTRTEKDAAKENMKLLQIDDLASKSFRKLSGGQKQRVLLARALCATTKILLLDEPVNGLDPKVTAEFYSLVKKLNDSGISVIMISHDLSALQYANKVLHLGRHQLFFGSKDKYMETPVYKALSYQEQDEEAKEGEGDA